MKTPIVLLIMMTVASIGYSQDDAALERRVSELEKEIAELKQSVAPLLAEARRRRTAGSGAKADECRFTDIL